MQSPLLKTNKETLIEMSPIIETISKIDDANIIHMISCFKEDQFRANISNERSAQLNESIDKSVDLLMQKVNLMHNYMSIATSEYLKPQVVESKKQRKDAKVIDITTKQVIETTEAAPVIEPKFDMGKLHNCKTLNQVEEELRTYKDTCKSVEELESLRNIYLDLISKNTYPDCSDKMKSNQDSLLSRFNGKVINFVEKQPKETKQSVAILTKDVITEEGTTETVQIVRTTMKQLIE